MSSYAEMSFLTEKISKVKNFCFEIGHYGAQKIHNFMLISKFGFLTLYLAPVNS
jgi:hypothetical protein